MFARLTEGVNMSKLTLYGSGVVKEVVCVCVCVCGHSLNAANDCWVRAVKSQKINE